MELLIASRKIEACTAGRQKAKFHSGLQLSPLEIQWQILGYCLPFGDSVCLTWRLNIGILGASKFYRTEGLKILAKNNDFFARPHWGDTVIKMEHHFDLLRMITRIHLADVSMNCHCKLLYAGLNVIQVAAMMPSLKSLCVELSEWSVPRICWTDPRRHSDYPNLLHEVFEKFRDYRRIRKSQKD